jgi:osmotically-inducible protein OsmY
VHLSGVAPTQFEKDQVLATAKSVPGVTNVVSDIAVDTSPLH